MSRRSARRVTPAAAAAAAPRPPAAKPRNGNHRQRQRQRQRRDGDTAEVEVEAGRRCGSCAACRRPECGACASCLRKRRVGSSSKRGCARRNCLLVPPNQRHHRTTTGGTSAAGAAAAPTAAAAAVAAAAAAAVSSATAGTFELGDYEADFDAALAALGETDPEARRSLEVLRDLPPAASYLLVDPEGNGHGGDRSHPTSAFHRDNKRKRPLRAAVEREGEHEAVPVDESFLYGMPIPVVERDDECAACDRPTAGAGCGEDVLLCDGRGCSREYHVGCCVPSLLDIPEGDWFCQDCNPEGSTSTLRRYFDRMAEQRGDQGRVKNLYDLIMADAGEAQVGVKRIPHSEIEGVAKYHYAAVRAVDEPDVVDHDDEYPRLGRDFFVGKPVRLYDDLHDHFHVGRIVDLRPTTDADADVSDFEYLVRFVAGSDDRKTTAHHWLALEEHNLSVGTTLVLVRHKEGGRPGSGAASSPQWVPALVWLRSTRALLSLHLLKHNFKSLATVSPPSAGRKRRGPGRPRGSAPIWASVRHFGSDEFVECNLRTQTEGFRDNVARLPRTGRDRFRRLMAYAEMQAQERVRRWHMLRLRAPYHPLALASQDEHRLGPLLPEGRSGSGTTSGGLPLRYQAPVWYAGLCPLVSRGLDRVRLLEEVLGRRRRQQQRDGGEEPTKDEASTLRCRIVSLSSVTSS